MAKKRITMRKIREVLRLRFEKALTYREISQAVGVGQTTVGDCLSRAKAVDISWPLPEDFTDDFLEQVLYSSKSEPTKRPIPLPDFDHIHRELRRKHVTLQLLWQEYLQANPGGIQYSQFCSRYRHWAKNLDLVMRQHHRPGEKMFVDYAGQTVPIYDPDSRKVSFKAQIFIATMGASNYTYAEASPSQNKSCWIRSHINAFRYFKGVPQLIVPDNLKSGVTKSCRFDPDINPTYFEMARHYRSAVMPARKRKPKDKAKAESAVLLVERWILAVLRKHQFFSVFELNQKIFELLEKLNNKKFQKIDGSRRSLFEKIDRPALLSLPSDDYQMTEGKVARVHIDYHIEVDKHFYSVPYHLARKEVEARYNDFIVEIFHANKKVTSHPRSSKRGGYTTKIEHMPSSHQKYAMWTPERIIRWASDSGPDTALVAEKILASKPHPEIGYKAVLGLITLGKKYGKVRLEAACSRVLQIGSPTYKSVKSTLSSGLDKKPIEKPKKSKPIDHENIRGREHFISLLEENS